MLTKQLFSSLAISALMSCYVNAESVPVVVGIGLYKNINLQPVKSDAPVYNCSALPDPDSYRCIEQVTGDQFIQTLEKLNQSHCTCTIYVTGQVELDHQMIVFNHKIIGMSGENGLPVEYAHLASDEIETTVETNTVRFSLPVSHTGSDNQNRVAGLPVFTVKPGAGDVGPLLLMGSATLINVVFDVSPEFSIRYFGQYEFAESALSGIYWLVDDEEDGLRVIPPKQKPTDKDEGKGKDKGKGKGKGKGKDKDKGAVKESSDTGERRKGSRIRRWSVEKKPSNARLTPGGGDEPPEGDDIDDDNSDLRDTERAAGRYEDQVEALRNGLAEIQEVPEHEENLQDPQEQERIARQERRRNRAQRHQEQVDLIRTKLVELQEEGEMDDVAGVASAGKHPTTSELDASLLIIRRRLNWLAAQRELLDQRADLQIQGIQGIQDELTNPDAFEDDDQEEPSEEPEEQQEQVDHGIE